MSTLRALAAFAVILISGLLIACDGASSQTPEPTASATAVPEATATSSPTPEPLPTDTPEPEPTETPEPEPTPVPQQSAPPQQPSSGGGGVTFATGATSSVRFTTSSFTVKTGTTVNVVFTNSEAGVPHDISFAFLQRTPCSGPCVDSFSFTAPAPGSYLFFCTVHPQMRGTLTVTP